MTDTLVEMGASPDVLKPPRLSLGGKPLSPEWPHILNDAEVKSHYDTFNQEQDTHFDRFGFKLTNGPKELIYFATKHTDNPDDPQMRRIVEEIKNFDPEILLYEGQAAVFPQSITSPRDPRLGGEGGLARFAVNEINKQRPAGQKIADESGDIPDGVWAEEFKKAGFTQEDIDAFDVARHAHSAASKLDPNARPAHLDDPKMKQMFDAESQFRDKYQIDRIEEALLHHNKVLVVMGSGHAIRQRQALEEYFQ